MTIFWMEITINAYELIETRRRMFQVSWRVNLLFMINRAEKEISSIEILIGNGIFKLGNTYA